MRSIWLFVLAVTVGGALFALSLVNQSAVPFLIGILLLVLAAIFGTRGSIPRATSDHHGYY